MFIVLGIYNFGCRIELLKPKKQNRKPAKLTDDDKKVEEFFIQENNDEISNEFEDTFEEDNFDENMEVEP